MKKTLLLILFSISINFCFAQKQIFQRRVDSTISKFGPNRSHSFSVLIGWGFLIGNEVETQNNRHGASQELMFGIRYKKKITRHFAAGAELIYQASDYHFKYTGPVALGVVPFDRAKISLNTFALNVYTRINFGRRGNSIGKYIDLGGYGDKIDGSSYSEYYKLPDNDPSNAKKSNVTYSDLKYVNKDIGYGVFARLGVLASGKAAIYGKYRLSDVFKFTPARNFETPRLSIGLIFCGT